ncbi:16S rRNA (uracil(1498)-N(3))-methyltransferase [Desulfobulbus sp. F1]|nr:16S rRNA (uracil(1498)-N(3))-methyltransferase [Desulfobulbus sp. F1]
MRRFFYDPAQDTTEHVLITGAEAHHLKTVLRMHVGAKAELYDGAGSVICGEIEQISANSVSFRILSRRQEQESCSPLTLVQALLNKGKKMDTVVQKATELGVHSFVPVTTRYCEPQGKDSQLLQRWQRIMLEACKQCGRPVPMKISLPQPLHELTFPAANRKIMPWENETTCPFAALGLTAGQPVTLLIGPEGGFHLDEVERAQLSGFTTVSLGPRILRAETASIVAAALVQHALHNLDPLP